VAGAVAAVAAPGTTVAGAVAAVAAPGTTVAARCAGADTRAEGAAPDGIEDRVG